MSTAHAFPTCCGITIISGFDNRTATAKLSAAAKTTLEDDLKARIANHKGVGLLLIAFNKHQVDSGMGRVAAELKFLRMGRYFYHPGHGNNIQLYGYYYHPENIVEHPDKKKASVTVTAGAKKKALVKKVLKRAFG